MSEFRYDPIQRRWVIIATGRSRRPTDFPVPDPMPDDSTCPFCEGNESETPPEVQAVRPEGSAPDSPGWTVRVFPNKFPALDPDAPPVNDEAGLFRRRSGRGVHEVVVESPSHQKDLPDLPMEQVEAALRMYRDRLCHLSGDGRYPYVQLFKNQGRVAGATRAHPHAQIVALPEVPSVVRTEVRAIQEHLECSRRCLFCDLAEQEIASGDRVIHADEHFVALCPYASRFPFEMLVVPRVHRPDFTGMSADGITGLSTVLREVLGRLNSVLGTPPYNLVLHTAPGDGAAGTITEYHWHVEIYPRLTTVAGFEWGTGWHINPTAPEEAARYLRDAEGPNPQ